MAKKKEMPKPLPEITNPVIKQALREIQNAKSIIRHNEGMIFRFEKEIKKELVKDMKDVDPDYVELGSKICYNSPYGSCFYDAEKDPSFDQCLICGGPDERK